MMDKLINRLRFAIRAMKCGDPGCDHLPRHVLTSPGGHLCDVWKILGDRVFLNPVDIENLAYEGGRYVLFTYLCGSLTHRELFFPNIPPYISLPTSESSVAEVLCE